MKMLALKCITILSTDMFQSTKKNDQVQNVLVHIPFRHHSPDMKEFDVRICTTY